jgi:glyoxylase-like metal-dependent hydrolase (beta-lactamase superfamily II)
MAKPAHRICLLEENDIIDIGGRCFEVLLLPGHTWGSIALLDRENRIVLVGDLASSMPVFMFGEDRDLGAYLASMEKLSRMKTAFDEIYPGHGTLPLPPGQIDKLIAAAKKLLAGELSPEDPPFPMPAKMYIYDGAGFFY